MQPKNMISACWRLDDIAVKIQIRSNVSQRNKFIPYIAYNAGFGYVYTIAEIITFIIFHIEKSRQNAISSILVAQYSKRK
jgi:hypothetical protein